MGYIEECQKTDKATRNGGDTSHLRLNALDYGPRPPRDLLFCILHGSVRSRAINEHKHTESRYLINAHYGLVLRQ